ncbi:MAG: hypothetical protein ACFFDW_08920 [Candidatus Thorarchaeota archaeon]
MTKEFEDFIKKQITLEKEIVKISNESVHNIKNVLVRELIRGIALDSEKHALLLTALKGIISGPTPLIEEVHFDEIKKTIEKHIELEAKAIDTYKEILDETKDEKVKMVVSEIYKDEIRHHTFLQKLLKALIAKETLTEDDLEDWMFKYAPFHGSPGG